MAHAFGRISREKAEGYDRFRFPYSEAVIHRMLDTVTPSPQAILDLGCGTGMVTRHLLGRAPVLYAVDPEPAMLGVAQESMGDAPGVLFIRGFAEDTGLPDASVDLITVGNAYHRFDPEPTLREFDRILRPGGMLAVISYGDVGTPDHPGFGEAIGAVMGDFSIGFGPAAEPGIVWRRRFFSMANPFGFPNPAALPRGGRVSGPPCRGRPPHLRMTGTTITCRQYGRLSIVSFPKAVT